MFFDHFRATAGRLPAGLIRTGPPANAGAIAHAEAQLGRRLPPAFAAFVASFDGADLFHEAVILGGVGDGAFRRLVDMNPRPRHPPLMEKDGAIFAAVAGGDHYLFGAEGEIVRVREGSDDRWTAGRDFSRWLDGLVAHQRVLYGADGEFLPDAFEPDGLEVSPIMALRQCERALRFCDDSAEWHHERGAVLRRMGRLRDARLAFARAAELDPQNPWPRFDGGRAALESGAAGAREAGASFQAAALLQTGAAAARLWVWAARAALLAADPERVAACRREARASDPAVGEQLRRARDAAAEAGEADEIAEAEALVEALESETPRGRARLPVVSSEAGPGVNGAAARPARRTRPPDPRHPRPSAPRRFVGPAPGRKR